MGVNWLLIAVVAACVGGVCLTFVPISAAVLGFLSLVVVSAWRVRGL